MGLASATELDELDSAARAHLQDPHTIVISGLLYLTWGRKPGRKQHHFPLASQAAPETIRPDTGSLAAPHHPPPPRPARRRAIAPTGASITAGDQHWH